MESNNAEEDRMFFLSEAEILLQQNKLPEALSLSEARLRRLPLDVDARAIAVNAFIGMGRLEEARNILREVGNVISELSLVYIRLGDIYGEKGYHQEAALCYEKFISLNPDSDKAKEVVEKIALLEQEEPRLAEIGEADNDNSSRPEFQTVTLADLYIRQGHFTMAAEMLEKILKRDPGNALARTKLDTVTTAIALQASVKKDIVQSDNLIETMTRWLENINRLKNHAAEK